jgi:hypothetical protein
MSIACSTNVQKRRMNIGYLWESQKERETYEDQDVGGWMGLGEIKMG